MVEELDPGDTVIGKTTRRVLTDLTCSLRGCVTLHDTDEPPKARKLMEVAAFDPYGIGDDPMDGHVSPLHMTFDKAPPCQTEMDIICLVLKPWGLEAFIIGYGTRVSVSPEASEEEAVGKLFLASLDHTWARFSLKAQSMAEEVRRPTDRYDQLVLHVGSQVLQDPEAFGISHFHRGAVECAVPECVVRSVMET